MYAINLIPVYCMPYEKKLVLVTNYVSNPKMQGKFNDGFLPPYVFSFFRTLWSAYFLFLQFKLIRQFRQKVIDKIQEINKDLLRWLCLFSYVLLILVVVHSVFSIIAPIFEISIQSIDGVLQLLVFVMTLQLFMQPKVLYGIFLPTEELISSFSTKTSLIKESFLSKNALAKDSLATIVHKNLNYKERIENHFKENTPFLNTNYSLNHLVNELQVPRHILSTFINQEYGVSFRKFINHKRVEYLIENFEQPLWQNLTLEAIANASGFLNRSTFILNFKEVTGTTPSVFFKNR
nr:helix-turn-helix domain-containing protein [uncultured Flavobacterium sp.]